MAESDRPEVFVHLLPALIPSDALRGGVAVVVDVLRATTVMVHALEAGCVAIIPCGEIDQAQATVDALPAGSALLAGERQGLSIEGFDLGNSPGDFTPDVCRGKTLVMTTTNGTRAILASLGAERVAVAAPANADAAAEWARSSGLNAHVVCAGTDGRISLEDTLLAGELADKLSRHSGYVYGNDEAVIAAGLYRDSAATARDEKTSWADLLARGRGGRRVRAIGLARDVDEVARWNWSRVVPVLRGDPPRLVKAD